MVRPFMPCPERGVPSSPVPELVVDDADHKHVRVGAIEFCYRRQGDGIWTYTGAVSVATGQTMAAGSFSEAFQVARRMVSDLLAGKRESAATAKCPECGQIFAEGPAGKAPFIWACQRVHSVASEDGWVTAWEPDGRIEFAPSSRRALEDQ